MSNPFVLILAGGQGTRLWPLTAKNIPKAFLCFDGTEVSLLQRTISRVKHLTMPEKIFIVSGRSYEQELKRQVNEIPHKNLILEPMARGTLVCIAFSMLYMKRKDQLGIVVTMPGEQLINDEIGFKNVISKAVCFAEKHNTAVALGIKPTFPAIRFGYIKIGKQINNDFPVFRSEGFTEKPDEKKAIEFLSTGKYLWNSGIYAFPISWLFKTMSELTPDIYEKITEIEKSIDTVDENEVIDAIYPNIRNISIDYAIMEKAEDLLVIPTDIDWNDMGTWTEVSETWEKDQNSNCHIVGKCISIDSKGCIIYSPQKNVALIGVKDVIIIDTPEGLLVCDKNRSDDVRLVKQET
ncbi:MAG: mannose-1-phosphate guanylyltransferase [Candidatus Poribacteria bacterium]